MSSETERSDDHGEDARLLDLAQRVTDGLRIDWAQERTGDRDADRELEDLRAVAEIAAQHRVTATPDPLFSWGSLRVLRFLGEGTFGEVYAAWDPALRREVALKLARLGTSRSLDEARQLARLRHRNVLTVYGVDVRDARAGIWTDLLHGRTLEDILQSQGALGPHEAVGVGIDLCAALAAVHAAGLVHGDVKTRNVMREGGPGDAQNSGRIVLMDFGSAHDRGESGGEASVPGTPLYTAPEVLRGAPPSIASDLYALGALLFRVLTLRYPYEAATRAELAERIERGERLPIRTLRPDLPATLVQVIERALHPDLRHRFASAGEMEQALLGTLGFQGQPARRSVRIGRAQWEKIRPLVLLAAAGTAAASVVTAWPHWIGPRLRPPAPAAAVARQLRAEIHGTMGSGLGQVIASHGDINGDGVPDLLIGAPSGDRQRGFVDVLFGGPNAGGIPDLVLRGEAAGDLFGTSVDAGDLDGDGSMDIVVGASTADGAQSRSGCVYVFFGGAKLDAQPDLVLKGDRSLQDFGYSVAVPGDMNGDGYADVLVGAPTDVSQGFTSGKAFVFFGGKDMDGIADRVLTRPTGEAQFGNRVARTGDLNGDGFADWLIAANWENVAVKHTGRAYVYFGGQTLDETPDLVLDGLEEGAWFGTAVCAADFSGDGYPDLALGSPYASGAKPQTGSVDVYFGGPAMDNVRDLHLVGDASGDLFGNGVAGVGDLNQDGFEDLLVGAYMSGAGGPRSGVVYFYAGGPKMDAVADWHIAGADNEVLGLGFAPLGDYFHDGARCVAIGAGGYEFGVGRASIYEFRRYVIARPRSGEILDPSTALRLSWLGAEPADVSMATDGGRTWRRVARAVGGSEQNTITLPAVEPTTDSLLIRIAPVRAHLPGAVDLAVGVRH